AGAAAGGATAQQCGARGAGRAGPTPAPDEPGAAAAREGLVVARCDFRVAGRPGRPRWMRAAVLAAGVVLAYAAPIGAQLPAIATEAPLDPLQGVNFHALVRPDTVYVGQQASYQVGVFLNDDVRGRLRR